MFLSNFSTAFNQAKLASMPWDLGTAMDAGDELLFYVEN